MTKSRVENKYVAETGTWGSLGRNFGEKNEFLACSRAF